MTAVNDGPQDTRAVIDDRQSRKHFNIGLQCLFETNFAFDGSRDTLPDNDGRQLRAMRRGHKRKLAYRHDRRTDERLDGHRR